MNMSCSVAPLPLYESGQVRNINKLEKILSGGVRLLLSEPRDYFKRGKYVLYFIMLCDNYKMACQRGQHAHLG